MIVRTNAVSTRRRIVFKCDSRMPLVAVSLIRDVGTLPLSVGDEETFLIATHRLGCPTVRTALISKHTQTKDLPASRFAQ